MKIAFATEDRNTISQHFGRAPYYLVVTAEERKVLKKEERSKAGHHNMNVAHEADHTDAQGRQGYGQAAQNIHTTMADAIKDCQVLICGGMGWGAYESLRSYNIETIITDVNDIDEALKRYLAGNLPNLQNRLH